VFTAWYGLSPYITQTCLVFKGLKGHLFTVGLVKSSKGDTCKQASTTDSYVPCDCESLAIFRFRHLDCHFMKAHGSEDISVSKVLHFAQGAGLLDA
jgi:hypothetical protein